MTEYSTETVVLSARELIAAAKIAKSARMAAYKTVRVERKECILTIAATDSYKVVRYFHEVERGEAFVAAFDAAELASRLKVSDRVIFDGEKLIAGAGTVSTAERNVEYLRNSNIDALLNVTDEGEAQHVGVNPAFMRQIMDAFKASDEYQDELRRSKTPAPVIIEFHGERKPITFRSQRKTFEALAMPVRIG